MATYRRSRRHKTFTPQNLILTSEIFLTTSLVTDHSSPGGHSALLWVQQRPITSWSGEAVATASARFRSWSPVLVTVNMMIKASWSPGTHHFFFPLGFFLSHLLEVFPWSKALTEKLEGQLRRWRKHMLLSCRPAHDKVD